MLTLDGIVEIERYLDRPDAFAELLGNLRRWLGELHRRDLICRKSYRDAKRAIRLLDALYWRLREKEGLL